MVNLFVSFIAKLEQRLIQCILFLLCLEGITSAYEKVSPMMIFCQGLMLLEIVHAAVGLVKGGVFPIFLQVSGC